MSKRLNNTKHRRSLKDRTTRAILERLQRDWDELSDVARGDRLRELQDRGCTLRGLAKHSSPHADNLPCSEGTLRRYVELSKLGHEHRKAIEAGEVSGDSVLLGTRDQRHKDRYLKKIADAEGFEKEVCAVVKELDQFMDEYHFEFSATREQIVNEIAELIYGSERVSKRDPVLFTLPPPAPIGADPVKIFKESRPVMKPSEEQMALPQAHFADQAAIYLFKRTPSSAVRHETLRCLRIKYEACPRFWIDTGLQGT